VDGLEAIKDRILFIAKEKASDIEYASKKQTDEIIEIAKEKAKEIKAISDKNAKDEAHSTLIRAKSLAVSERRKILLVKKQEIIEEILDEAQKRISNMDSKIKSDIYLKMLEENITGAENEIIVFNSQDREIAIQIKNKISKSFEISEESGDFSGGFIIKRGHIQINMTFEMIIKQYRNELIGIAADSVFKKEN